MIRSSLTTLPCLMVPYSVLKDLEKQTSSEQDYMIQGVHDRLLTYLYNEQEKINGGKNVK